MKAIILAAGFGTRLYPLTENTAKGLLEYKGKPMMTHLVNEIRKLKSIDEVVIAVNGKFFQDYITWRRTLEYKDGIFLFSNQIKKNDERLGAVVDLHNTIKTMHYEKEDLFVVACDYHLEGLKGMYEAMKYNSIVAVIKKQGQVKIIDEKIHDFKEKTIISEFNALPVYMLKKRDLDLLEKYITDSNNPFDSPGCYIQHIVECGRRPDVYRGLKAIAIEDILKEEDEI